MTGVGVGVRAAVNARKKRLQELAASAEQKKIELADNDDALNSAYYGGFADGLRRAIRVLEGKG